jgi:putative SOS response-associated peptidase YedK
MCNLYSNTTALEAMRRLFKLDRVDSSAGNFAGQASIFPAYEGAVVRQVEGQLELTMMHWGFILPQKDKAAKVVNNTRDDKVQSSSFWKSSFEERRCLIPASSFAEYHPTHTNEKGHKTVVWFSIKGDEPRPPFAFAGIWRHWKGNYKDELREMNVYSMLTTKPNELVKPIHPTRMPVILHPDDHEQWLSGTADEAKELLKPYDPNFMRIALEGGKSDEGQTS